MYKKVIMNLLICYIIRLQQLLTPSQTHQNNRVKIWILWI